MREPYCVPCGSTDIYRKRIAYWSGDKQVWIDEPFCDEMICNECGCTSVDIREEEDA